MISICFQGECFNDFESSLCFLCSGKKDTTNIQSFMDLAQNYLYNEKKFLVDEDKERKFIKSSEEDISFMRNILNENLKKSVVFNFESIINCYTMNPEEKLEHCMVLESKDEYYLLYWNTTA
jgi:hypothetical protein